MKHFGKVLVIFISVFLILSMSGCAELFRVMESPDAREQTEEMLDAIFDDYFTAAYDLIKKHVSVEDFRPVFRELADNFKGVTDYELSLLYVNYNTVIDDGKTFKVVYSQYKLVCDKGDFVVSVNILEESGEMFYFHVASFENTSYHYVGTVDSMNGASPLQWALLLLNLVTQAFAVVALVDCCRKKIKLKALWILIIIFGFVTFSFAFAVTGGLKVNFNMAGIFGYSALITYGNGDILFRLLNPVGAALYYILRRKLIKKPQPSPSGEMMFSGTPVPVEGSTAFEPVEEKTAEEQEDPETPSERSNEQGE